MQEGLKIIFKSAMVGAVETRKSEEMKTSFGRIKDGREASLYTIENDHILIKVLDYGATLVSFVDKETGIDVVEGFDSVEDYIQYESTHIGASIGRIANRVEKGILHLNGAVYQLPINNHGNSLHGGICGFNTKLWTAEEEKNQITFSYTSPDGEEGYPGTLHVKVTYRLLDNGIAIISEGTSDVDTVFAYTNHSYFNCDGSNDVLHHTAVIYGDHFGPTDENGLTKDELMSVEGTPFDFRTPKEIGRDINIQHPQIIAGKGYDHYFDIDGFGLRNMVKISGQKLSVTMSSDFPGFQFYSSNFLKGEKGKNGMAYPARSAVCLEGEYFPNGINYEDIKDKPIVHAGKPLCHEIRYVISKN